MRWLATLLLAVVCAVSFCAVSSRAPAQPTATRPAASASPEAVAELRQTLDRARERLEARDARGVLAHVSERYRSEGLTKADVGQHLVAMCSLYEQIRARVAIDQTRVVDGVVWVYTTGEVSGRLPFVGWVTALSWQKQPEVVRKEGTAWRLFGFQN